MTVKRVRGYTRIKPYEVRCPSWGQMRQQTVGKLKVQTVKMKFLYIIWVEM